MTARFQMHTRVPHIERVHISDLRVPATFQADPRMVRLINQLDVGRIKCALTRLDEGEITTGYYRRSNAGPEHVTNLAPDLIAIAASGIREGFRPPIGVYWSPLAPGRSKYVCPDDEVALAAYRSLGISNVPCLIYRPKKSPLPEAAIWTEKEEENIILAGSVPSSRTSVAMTFGLSDPEFGSLVASLIAQCLETRRAIRRFHNDGALGIHYHHVLHATLARHERALDSIHLMVERGRVEHAEALLRVAYEAFLNFYLDWLSPSFFGPRLQLLSMVRNAELLQTDQHDGERLQSSLNVISGFLRLLETTAEKARLSPLGSAFHSYVYPPLSLVSHQSYGNVEAEANSFETEQTQNFSTRTRQLGRWLDVITTAMTTRIRDDIGFERNSG